MSDEQTRELERRAKSGDVESAARLVILHTRRFAGLCGHWLASRRLWVEAGQQRHDRFCLYCGLNFDAPVPGRYWRDCGGAVVERMNEEQAARMARMAAEAEAERARREEEHRYRIFTLRERYPDLQHLTDDELEEFHQDLQGADL